LSPTIDPPLNSHADSKFLEGDVFLFDFLSTFLFVTADKKSKFWSM
jgi:hypothetical protein